MSDQSDEWPAVERRGENAALIADLQALAAEAKARIDQLDAHKDTLDGVGDALAGAADALDRVNTTMTRLVPREEAHALTSTMNRQRRFSFVVLAFAIFCSIQLVDLHTEACSPGARTEKVLQALLRGDIVTMDDFQRVASRNEPTWFCEASFPTHTHNPDRPWPTNWNLVGVAVFVALASWGLWFIQSWRRDPVIELTSNQPQQEE